MKHRLIARCALAGVIALAAASFEADAQPSAVNEGNAGLSALERGDYREAIRLFTRALASRGLSSSDRALAYSRRGDAYLKKGDNGAAISDLEHALRLNPGDGDAQADLAEARSNAGAPTAGGRESPERALADANAGMDAMTHGEYAQAVALFTRAIDSGGLSTEDSELAHLSRGKAYLQRADYVRAVADIGRALELNAGDQEAQAALGQALIRLRARAPAPPIDAATCAANYASKGNFFTGRTATAWALYPTTAPTDAFAGAFTFLTNEKWTISAADLRRGVMSATEQVPGSPRTVGMDVRVEPSGSGSRASVTMTVGSLLVATDTKGYLCKMLAAVPAG